VRTYSVLTDLLEARASVDVLDAVKQPAATVASARLLRTSVSPVTTRSLPTTKHRTVLLVIISWFDWTLQLLSCLVAYLIDKLLKLLFHPFISYEYQIYATTAIKILSANTILFVFQITFAILF